MAPHTRNPILKPYHIQSAPDCPDPSVLIDDQNGRSLFISSQEKDYIHRLNGDAIETHIQSIFHHQNKPLSSFAKLLHDLDHFGFLENAQSEPSGAPELRLNFIGKALGRLFSSVFFFGLLCLVIIMTLPTVFIQSPPLRFFQLDGSSAWGAMLVLFGSLAFIWTTAWVHSVSLTALTGRGQKVSLCFKTGFPIPLLNESACYSLSFYQRVRMVALPALCLLSGLGLCLYAATLALSPFWIDAATQLALGGVLALMIYTSPWFDSPYSRAAQWGFRKNSQASLIYDSFRTVFHFLFGGKEKQQSRAFIAWGAWTLIWPLLTLRILTTVFRNDFPRFADQMTQEIGSPGWWATLALTVLIGGGAIIAITSTAFFFIRRTSQNLIQRWRPQQTHLLLLSLFALVALITCRVPFLPAIVLPAAAAIFQALLGLALVYSIIHQTHLRFRQPSSWPWYGIGLLGAAHIVEALNPAMSFIIHAWVFITALTVLNGLRNGRLSHFILLVPFFGGMFFLFRNDHSLFQVALMIAVFTLAAQWVLTINNRERLAWGWLLFSALLACAQLQLKNYHMLEIWITHLSLASAIIAVLARMTVYDLQLSSSHSRIIDKPLDRLMFFITKITGLNVPIQSSENFNGALFQIKSQLSQSEWRSAIKHWLPTLTWVELQSFPTLLQEIEHDGGVSLNEETIINSMLRVPCLRGFDLDQSHLMSIARIWIADPGDILIRQGENDDALAVILSGQVDVEDHHNCVSPQTIAHLHAGAFIGEVAFLTNEPRTATVRAAQPVIAVAIRRRDVQREFPQLETHLKETAEERQWSQRLTTLPLFNEMPHSLFLRTVLQTEFHHIHCGAPLTASGPDSDCLYAILKGDIQSDGRAYSSGEWIGVDSLYTDAGASPALQATSDSQIIAVPRKLALEAIDEILLQEHLLST